MTSTTVYEPLITTVTYTTGEVYERLREFSLAPQTTPFTPPAGTCSVIPRSIRCQTQPDKLTSSDTCLGDMMVAETGASFPTQCFPEQYLSIWRLNGQFSDVPNLAYPGTACLSGWTTACTTAVRMESAKTYDQTWCCPPGSWTCLTVGGVPDRDCVSVLSTPTEVWVNNLVSRNGGEETLYSSWRKVSLSNLPSIGPLQVLHPAFPLYGRVPDEFKPHPPDTGLSTGAIAGIAVGAVVAVLLLVGGGVFICLRRRRQRNAARLAQLEVAGREAGDSKGMGYDSKQELPGQSSETREMKAMSPVELSSHTRIAEVEGSRPVELSS